MEIKMNIEMASLGYVELREKFKKGLRNGNWRKLNWKEKALYRAAMAYTKLKKKGGMAMDIVNGMIVEKLLGLVERLKETKGMRIFKRGFKKAVEMLENGEERGVFAWAPSLRHWLKDPDYIFWLGTVR
uniref:Uncharacterized protein n=1 Tax=Candidatus Methanophagaceae archaeon ANME-1 ERB6 TaxID=2759912 RepID=A0A7G9YYX8_9EURY|nr:hypothetical protein HNLOENAD_00012 [Methanosarcinales archaeon ANME-1 ERB6]